MLYDVIIAGLGPGGATAAYELASRGLRVLAFDKEKFPRYKPCGGCLSLKVENALPFDFKAVVEDTIYGVVFTYRSKRPLRIVSPKIIGYNVNRDRFDNLLKEKAKESGADVREGERVVAVEEFGDSVDVKTSNGLYRSKILIGADGANSIIAREVLGFNPKLCAVAIEAEIPFEAEKQSELKGMLLIDFGCIPHGYGWVFPKGKSLSVGIAGISDKVKGRVKECFGDFVKREKSLSGLNINDMHGWTIPYFHPPQAEGQRIAKARVLAVGDAAHLVDPFLGEGIYYAIRSAQLAAKIVSEEIRNNEVDLNRYDELVAAELYPELRAAAKLGRLVYNFPGLWYNILESEPSLMERYYDVIRGEKKYEGFYRDIISRIKTRPWRLIVMWLKGFFGIKGR